MSLYDQYCNILVTFVIPVGQDKNPLEVWTPLFLKMLACVFDLNGGAEHLGLSISLSGNK
jgi:hypothetical protein